MGLDVLAQLVSGLLAVLGFGALSTLVDLLSSKVLGSQQKREISYTERLSKLTDSLKKTSAEMDGFLAELTEVARERQEAMQKLETGLTELQSKEKELQDRINHLQNVPLPAAEYFAQLTAQGEKKSARRDFLLFVAGVVVSTIIAIALKFLGWG